MLSSAAAARSSDQPEAFRQAGAARWSRAARLGRVPDLPAHQAAAAQQEPGHYAQAKAGMWIPGGQKRSGAAHSSAACPLQSLDSARRVLPSTAGVPPGLSEPQYPRHARHSACYQKSTPGGVAALGVFTQIGAFWVNPLDWPKVS